MGPWLDYTINGLIVGNVYALLAVGLALIFGVSHLINFAQGSIYMVGAFIGWTCAAYLHTPLPVTMLIVVAGCALLGVLIERIGLRPLAGAARIAPLLATIGISLALDQTVQLIFSPDPRALENPLPNWRLQIGTGTIGALDLLIAATGIVSAAVLFGFLRFSRLGWAVRATAQDSEAARQMGVDTDAVNRTVFAIAAGLGGLSGLLVGMYYNHIDTAMSFQATLKGIVAQVIGGMGNVPGAIGGAMLLGLTESYGVALFGSSYRNLFAFVLLLVMLVLRPNGLFAPRRSTPPEPLTGTFVAPSRPWTIPAAGGGRRRGGRRAAAAAAGSRLRAPGADQRLALRRARRQPDAGGRHARPGVARPRRAAADRRLRLGAAGARPAAGRFGSAFPPAGVVTAALGTALTWPAFRLRSHYVSIATLGIGEIVGLVILNWESLTRGPMGVTGIPPLEVGPVDLSSAEAAYWVALAALVLLALAQTRLLRTHLGRTFRAIRDDDVAARTYGISLDRYKGLAFAVSGFAAGISGAISAHLYSYINNETWTSQVSILALTMVILGGMGNTLGAVVGALLLTGLPEVFRFTAEYRLLIYGLVLLLVIRFRPQGLLGTA